jgi:hypothetical protein
LHEVTLKCGTRVPRELETVVEIANFC